MVRRAEQMTYLDTLNGYDLFLLDRDECAQSVSAKRKPSHAWSASHTHNTPPQRHTARGVFFCPHGSTGEDSRRDRHRTRQRATETARD